MAQATIVGDVADLARALAWPVIVLAILLLLREPIVRLAERIGSSAQKVSIGPQGVTVDFAAAVAPVAAQSATVLADLRHPAPMIFDSGAMTMLAQLEGEQPAPHLLIDLGEGREWLTSRLYLFSLMLAAMRRTRTLIFVETLAGVRGRFVGLSSPQHVRAALARAYPWLEADYAHAYSDATQAWRTPAAGQLGPLVLDDEGRLARVPAQNLMRQFIDNLKIGAPGPTPDDPNWVQEQVEGMMLVEHARWLTGADMERLLGSQLHRFASLQEVVPRPPQELAAATLQMTGHSVIALVDQQHRFRGVVIDRQEVLEILAMQSGADDPQNRAKTPGP